MRLVHAAAIALDGDAPPKEFRIFAAGPNYAPQAHGAAGTDGVFQFTAASAARIMAEYAAHGVDMMIDLNHGVRKEENRADTHDARGWYKLEVRAGELWAVDVKWTPDGARRLAEKTQRYISPLFGVDESGTILDLVNCALTAQPALYGTPALVAASRAPAPRMTRDEQAACRAALGMLIRRELRASKQRAKIGKRT